MNPRRMVWSGTVCGCLVLCGSLVRANEASVAELVGKLASSNESVRLEAIDQLGARGAKSAAAVASLTERLKDDSAQVRAHAVRALGEIGAPAKPAVAALVELAKDPDETVRRQVVKAVIEDSPRSAGDGAALRQAAGGSGSGRADAHLEHDCRGRPPGRARPDRGPETSRRQPISPVSCCGKLVRPPRTPCRRTSMP